MDKIYIAGTNTSSGFPAIYVSDDQGQTWTNSFQGENNANIQTGWCGYQGNQHWWWAEEALGFHVSPSNPKVALMSDFGFVHLTTDGGLNWKAVYVNEGGLHSPGAPTPKNGIYQSNGMEITTVWQLFWWDAQKMYASYTDICCSYSADAGKHWSYDHVSNTANTTYMYTRQGNNLYAATSSIHDMYQSTYLTDAKINGGKGSILFSLNEGITWNTLHDFQHPVIWMAHDPMNPEVMYASVVHSTEGGIFKTSNLSAGSNSTWTKLPPPSGTEGHPYNIRILPDGTILTSWSGRRTTVFTKSSGVFISVNGGNSWTNVSHPDMAWWTKDVVEDPLDPNNTWYAGVFSGWGGGANDKGGLFKTKNRGASWTKVWDGFRVESITIDPSHPDRGLITTEDDGLWYSEDLNSNAPTFDRVDEFPFIHPMRAFFHPVNKGEVWIATFGNGIYSCTWMSTAITPPVETDLLQSITFDPMHQELHFGKLANQEVQIQIVQVNGVILDQKNYTHAPEKIHLPNHFEPGSYFVYITSGADSITLTWNVVD